MQRYAELQSDSERESFLRALYVANRQFANLSNREQEADAVPENVNYKKRGTGEAYALWYHMLRCENVYTALEQIYGARPLPSSLRVLDVGSGTGAGALATGYLMQQQCWDHGKSASVSITCAEGAPEIRDIADRVLGAFRNMLQLPESRFDWNHDVADLRGAAHLPRTRVFELILFSYTFWTQQPGTWEGTKQLTLNVARHLAPDGVLCFLTPRHPPEKIDFINDVARTLETEGFSRIDVDPAGVHASNRPSPLPIIEARSFYNQERDRLGMDNIFRGTPYYRFSAQCDVFTR